MVVDYRTRVLKISEEDELDTKLTRIPSAKKYKGKRPCLHYAPLPPPMDDPGGGSMKADAQWACLVFPTTFILGHIPFCP